MYAKPQGNLFLCFDLGNYAPASPRSCGARRARLARNYWLEPTAFGKLRQRRSPLEGDRLCKRIRRCLVSGLFSGALIGRRAAAARIRRCTVGRGRTGRVSGLLRDVRLRRWRTFRTLSTGSPGRSARAGSASRSLRRRLFANGFLTANGGSAHQYRDSPDGSISCNVSQIVLHAFTLSGSLGHEHQASAYFGYLDNQASDRTRTLSIDAPFSFFAPPRFLFVAGSFRLALAPWDIQSAPSPDRLPRAGC